MSALSKLNYDERQAFALVRKTIKRKPELAGALMEGMSRDIAVSILRGVQKDLADMMAVSHAFSEAAASLVKLDKPEPPPC